MLFRSHISKVNIQNTFPDLNAAKLETKDLKNYTLFSFMYLLLPSLCIRYLSNRQSPLHIPCSTVVELHSPLWTIAMSLSLLHTLRPADSVTSPSSILPECRREQRSPNLLAPGTCFMEETDRGVCEGGMVQAVM